MQLYDGLFSASGSRGDLVISSENKELKIKTFQLCKKSSVSKGFTNVTHTFQGLA